MRARRRSVWAVSVLTGVALLVSGCDLFRSGLSTSELEQRAVDLMRAMPVEPLDGADFDVTVSDVKLDEPYVSAHGVGNGTEAQEMVAALTSQLQGDGFDVHRSQPVDYSLGFEVLASDGMVVVRAQIGPGDASSAAYPPLEDGSYLAVQVANIDSGPGWTEVDR